MNRFSPPDGTEIDLTWLNDRSEFQLNFVHGLKNPLGLQIQYEYVEGKILGEWVPDNNHMSFPGFAHGGLLLAILDDAMGRIAAIYKRWVVTGRLESRFRNAAPVDVPLQIRAEVQKWTRGTLRAKGEIIRVDDDSIIVEATALYLPLSGDLQKQMIKSWPGFAKYVGDK